jgi:hypothetical protein
VIDFTRIEQAVLATQPYEWASVGDLFSPAGSAALASSFPRDHFKTVKGYDGEKGYEYEARALIGMGAGVPSRPEALSDAWRLLAADLLSPAYRAAVSRLVGRDLGSLPIEVNVFHYGARAWLGPHVDLRDKLITHVLYFNESWDENDGGCLNILRSSDMSDAVASVAPVVGNSVLLVRSEKSWHAVSPVADRCHRSRLSMTVTFYRPGSVSTMWPPGDTTPLHTYNGVTDAEAARGAQGLWKRLRLRVASRPESTRAR